MSKIIENVDTGDEISVIETRGKWKWKKINLRRSFPDFLKIFKLWLDVKNKKIIYTRTSLSVNDIYTKLLIKFLH